MDDFLFDLRGYIILRDALEPALIDELNALYDRFPPIENGEWWGNAQRRDYAKEWGFELHNAVEAGEPFERLIDYPGWINYMRHYCGEEGTYVEGLFIDEFIAMIRRSGGYFPVHSGGYHEALRGKYVYEDGKFRCGQVNVIAALCDIDEGDGSTLVIPGSHKSHFPHPERVDADVNNRMDTLTGTVPVYLKKGDALLFVDGLMHGASSRTNPGERRVVLIRYGVSWGATRYGYTYSEELLSRLTPERRKILQPVPPNLPPEG
jgi:hypothetical protein